MTRRPAPLTTDDLTAKLAELSIEFAQPHPSAVLAHANNFAWVPARAVDLVLSDPPFNVSRVTNFHTYEGNTIHSYKFDANKDDWDTYTHEEFLDLMGGWAREFARVLRPGGHFAIFCADAYISHLIDALRAAGLQPRRTITWRKPNAVPVNRGSLPMSACEYIVMGVRKGKGTFNSTIDLVDVDTLREIEPVLVADKVASIVGTAVRDRVTKLATVGDARPADVAAAIDEVLSSIGGTVTARVTGMYVGDEFRGCVPNYIEANSKGGKRIHKTEKPVTVLRYLTALLSRPGDLVLDPFSGSGSSGEAAVLTNRRVVLVERDQEYFEKSSERLRALG